jgi:hypothetical protein
MIEDGRGGFCGCRAGLIVGDSGCAGGFVEIDAVDPSAEREPRVANRNWISAYPGMRKFRFPVSECNFCPASAGPVFTSISQRP